MKNLWTLLALLGLTVGAMMLFARSGKKEWTTDSEPALEAFLAGQEARMKLYDEDARDHYERAIELDSEFIAAKLALLRSFVSRDRRKQLIEELSAADLSRLTAREQFLVRYGLAQAEGHPKEAKQILHSFGQAYPADPYGLDARAERAWYAQNWDEAEKLYRKLLTVDPNWVQAQNRLGYIAMARGDFAAAEEMFKTYKYIAPDQANPHDSMGELLTVVGRYDEARAELEQALEIKNDFCDSYNHLVDVAILEGAPKKAGPILDRAEPYCSERFVELLRCDAQFWVDYMAGDYDAPWREERRDCVERIGAISFQIHRMACLTGRLEVAVKMEEILRREAKKRRGRIAEEKHIRGLLYHLEGVRNLLTADSKRAAELLAGADREFYYWGQELAIMKLFNQINLAAALELDGDTEASARVLEEIRRVNPPFADTYPHLLAAVER